MSSAVRPCISTPRSSHLWLWNGISALALKEVWPVMKPPVPRARVTSGMVLAPPSRS
jgi:hypothetical protein